MSVLSAVKGASAMGQPADSRTNPARPARLEPAAEPPPGTPAGGPFSREEPGADDDALLQFLEAAWRAAGCKKLSEIAEELDRAIPRRAGKQARPGD
jgi:hypothetical protein